MTPADDPRRLDVLHLRRARRRRETRRTGSSPTTRASSRGSQLTIDGRRPLLLSSGNVEYFSAAFFLRNPLAKRPAARRALDQARALRRRRHAGSHRADERDDAARSSCALELELAADFADIISVKEYDFSLGDPTHAKPLPRAGRRRATTSRTTSSCSSTRTGYGRTQVILSRARRRDAARRRVTTSTLAPRETWDAAHRRRARHGRRAGTRAARSSSGTSARSARVSRESLAAWQLRVPQLRASWDDLRQTFGQSVNDLAALRMRTATTPAAASSRPPACRGS